MIKTDINYRRYCPDGQGSGDMFRITELTTVFAVIIFTTIHSEEDDH